MQMSTFTHTIWAHISLYLSIWTWLFWFHVLLKSYITQQTHIRTPKKHECLQINLTTCAHEHVHILLSAKTTAATSSPAPLTGDIVCTAVLRIATGVWDGSHSWQLQVTIPGSKHFLQRTRQFGGVHHIQTASSNNLDWLSTASHSLISDVWQMDEKHSNI